MKQLIVPGLVALVAAACAQTPPGPPPLAQTPPRPLIEEPVEPLAPPEPPPQAPAAATAINVVGTPIHAVLKAGVCVSSFALAVPIASLIALTDRPDRREWHDSLARGVGHNCGGSYVLGG